MTDGRGGTRPLRVAVCTTQVPFERGGAEILVDSLVAALRERGHEADAVTLPFKWYPSVDLLQGALAWRMLDLTEANGRPIDVVVATKFPAYLVRHPRKVVWLFHQFRQAYELHGTALAQFADDAEGVAMREAIREMDTLAFAEARGVFTISQNVTDRLRRFNDVHSTVLRPPPQRLGLSWLGDDGYVLSVGRLDAAKRNDLLLRAAAQAPGVEVVVVGEGPERAPLEALAAELGLGGRVRFTGRVGEQELEGLYGRCRAVFYAPFDEDYGFVPIEAHMAGKPVVTTTDAGGPLEFVRDGETGLVTAPTPAAVAAGLSRLHADPDLARRLGAAGAQAGGVLDWDAIVNALLGAA
ncbi:MAG: glycosyltransferase family 4 protein [Actinomycetota bacterium]